MAICLDFDWQTNEFMVYCIPHNFAKIMSIDIRVYEITGTNSAASRGHGGVL